MEKGVLSKIEESLKQYGDSAAFNIALVAEGLDIIKKLHQENAGTETVEQRVGEYKSWDPDIFKVDKDVEDTFVDRLKDFNRPVTLLSEEAGRVEINQEAKGEPCYAVADPFDGSYLFKRAIPDFWYSSLSLFNRDCSPISCAVGDGVHRDIAFANQDGAYIGEYGDGQLQHILKLDKSYRKSAGREDVADLSKASIESYAMKPKKFMFPLVDEYRKVFEPFKFFLPNGGPYGFVDVATGKIDVYFALRQPFVDVFSGIYIAQQAGVAVSDFEGNPVKMVPEEKSVHDVLVSTNPALHKQVLELIEQSIK